MTKSARYHDGNAKNDHNGRLDAGKKHKRAEIKENLEIIPGVFLTKHGYGFDVKAHKQTLCVNYVRLGNDDASAHCRNGYKGDNDGKHATKAKKVRPS